jgi:hypothetical protein
VPVDGGAARGRLEQRGEDPDERGLAGPVRADESEHVAGLDVERHAAQGGVGAVRLSEIADLDHGGGPWKKR